VSELTDMADRIRATTASGVPITARAQRSTAFLPAIGLSGYAGTGKTEAARFIEHQWGYQRQHIAEPLRRMIASLLSEYGYSERNIERFLTGEWKDGVVIPELGVTSRHLQITLGTEWGRRQIGDDIWAKLWCSQATVGQLNDGKARMNDSVRFPNEESAIRASGGLTILIVRPGTGPAAFKWGRFGKLLYRWFGCMWGVHDSERVDRLRPDHVVVNDGSIAQLHFKINAILTGALR
jgi:hypothetical protein